MDTLVCLNKPLRRKRKATPKITTPRNSRVSASILNAANGIHHAPGVAAASPDRVDVEPKIDFVKLYKECVDIHVREADPVPGVVPKPKHFNTPARQPSSESLLTCYDNIEYNKVYPEVQDLSGIMPKVDLMFELDYM